MDGKSETLIGRNHLNAGGAWRLAVLAGVLALLCSTAYSTALRSLVVSVLERQGSSHGLFVPFISAYLLWLNWDDIRAATFRPAFLAGALFTSAGIVLFLFGYATDGFRLISLSFLCMVAGLIIFLFGQDVFNKICFALLFLATMIPLPESAYANLAECMRTMTAWGSVGLLKLTGIPHYRDGFDLYLNNLHLEIAYGCSGIRYLLSYLVFGTAYAFRFKTTGGARLATVAAAVPLSIIGGIIRLFLIFFSASYVGPFFAEGRPHVLLSWSVFTALLILAIAIDQMILKKKIKEKK